METSYHREWFQKQIEKADKIIEIYGDQGIFDAEIILCCTVSGLASTLWRRNEKDKVDRKRFVEFLVKFSKTKPSVEKISACLLARQFEQNDKRQVELRTLINRFFKSEFAYFAKSPFEYGGSGTGLYAGTLSSIIDPEDIDGMEHEIRELMPALRLGEIRKASYANIIYTEIRSGLIHEYELTDKVTDHGWNHNNDRICYVNFLIPPNEEDVQELLKKHNIKPEEARDVLTKSERRLFFPYSYIKDIISESVNNLFEYWEYSKSFDQPYPPKWWAEG